MFGCVSVFVSLGGEASVAEDSALAIDSSVLRRIVENHRADAFSVRLTWDLFETANAHLYVRLEAKQQLTADDFTLEIRLMPAEEAVSATIEREDGAEWGVFAHGTRRLGVVVKKFPWIASWNDVGCYDHRTLASAELVPLDDGAMGVRALGPIELDPGQTLETAVFLREASNHAGREALRREATYGHPDEARYVPEGEFRHQRVWETESVWLGPPIFDGCPQRPYDQLIPRPLGLNVLARKRFTWSNEDFSLAALTGKDRYRESGVKKAFALLATQNAYGGWFEGIEFYNLPPHHHHMYDTYISGLFLLEAFDQTGYEPFLEAAARSKRFWLSEPPANGHVEVAPGAWWYRWGGYVNEFGYTDERCVLNTHCGATAFLAMFAERTGDTEARDAAEAGIAAVRWGLERGIQRGDGQFLYCLSQVDPTLERPGDPPYLRLDLVPQIEDVYTVASSYRLLMALRTIDDEAVRTAVRRALDYWWTAYRAGRVYTYRAYAVIAYAVAAGDIDLRYALALPELLRDPQHFTSLQRGLSSFVAPHGLPRLDPRIDGAPARFVEPVFVRRRRGEFLFALVNVEQPVARVPVRLGVPAGTSIRMVEAIDPASADLETRAVEWSPVDGGSDVRLTIGELQEFAVAVVRVELNEPDG